MYTDSAAAVQNEVEVIHTNITLLIWANSKIQKYMEIVYKRKCFVTVKIKTRTGFSLCKVLFRSKTKTKSRNKIIKLYLYNVHQECINF